MSQSPVHDHDPASCSTCRERATTVDHLARMLQRINRMNPAVVAAASAEEEMGWAVEGHREVP